MVIYRKEFSSNSSSTNHTTTCTRLETSLVLARSAIYALDIWLRYESKVQSKSIRLNEIPNLTSKDVRARVFMRVHAMLAHSCARGFVFRSKDNGWTFEIDHKSRYGAIPLLVINSMTQSYLENKIRRDKECSCSARRSVFSQWQPRVLNVVRRNC